MKKLILILLVMAESLFGQSLSVFDIDTSAFPTIKAKFYAFDASGNQILNLLPSDFEVTEDGVKRNVTYISCPAPKPPVPISSVLTIDVSGSMTGSGIGYAKEAAKAWVQALPLGQSECAITSFNSNNFFNQDFTTNRNRLLNRIEELTTNDGTDFNAALINPMSGGLLAVEKGKYKKIVILLTDGYASGNESAIIQKANQINAIVFCVTIATPCPPILRNISEQTGGQWFENITTAEQAREVYLKILNIVQGGEPCNIEWESGYSCTGSIRNVEIKLFNSILKVQYSTPFNGLAKLEFEPTYVYFMNKEPGKYHDTTIKVTARGVDFDISDIISSNSSFQLTPKNIILKAGESKNLTLSFTPTDSGYTYTELSFVNNICQKKYYASGGFRGVKPSMKTLKLTHPDGGEKFVVGSDTIITWEGIPATDTVSLEYSIDDGVNWVYITKSATGLKYFWGNIHKPVSNMCLIRVKQCLDYNKTDSVPQIEWQKCLGGNKRETAHSIQQTMDCGYIVAGYTISNDGDVSGNHGLEDLWIVKLNVNGSTEWQKCLGGSHYDKAFSIQQTMDGGYIVAGHALSNDGDVSGNHGNPDYWIAKLQNNGDIEWQKCLGGVKHDGCYSIQETNDGGFIVAGQTYSNDGDVNGNHGDLDYWVVKLQNNGEIEWQKCLGGKSTESAHSIQQTMDGGYIVAGKSGLDDGDVSGHHGRFDFWIVKLKNNGDIEWQRCLGGSFEEEARSIKQTIDGGYIVAGISKSNDGDVSENHGNYDIWIVKLNISGDIEWQKCIGGSYYDDAASIQQATDGGYIVAGSTLSNDGDVSGHHQDNWDYWIVKLSPTGKIIQQDVSDSVFSIVAPQAASYDIDMGRVIINQQKDSVVYDFVMNSGSWKFCVDSIYFRGVDASAFSMLAGFPKYEIEASKSNFAEIRFAPTEVRQYQAEVVIITQADTLIQNIIGEGVQPRVDVLNKIIDFGQVVVGGYKDSLQVLTVQNTGTAPISILYINQGGPDMNSFTINSGGNSLTLQPGEIHKMDLRFEPESHGRTSGALNFFYNGTGSPATVQLFGEGIEPELYLLNDTIDFGKVVVSKYKDTLQIATIKNVGNASLTITSTNHAGNNSVDFSTISGGGSIVLDPGEETLMDLRFAPTITGKTDGILEFFNDNDLEPVKVNLLGEGISPKLLILQDTIDFGKVIVSKYMDTLKVATIKNVGNAELTITSTNHAGNNSVDFSTISGYGPFTLSPGEEATMDLRFKPSSAGKTDGTIEFHYDSPQSPALVYLLGEGWSVGTSTMTIESQSVEAYPGDIVEINIILKDHEYLEFTKATGINIDFFFNQTLLWPLEETFEYIDDTTAKLYLEDLPIRKNKEEDFIRIKCKVGLGNKEECVLLLSNAESIGEEIQINLISGNFNLLGICREGGTRLVNPNAQAGMMTIAPNPAENKLDISLLLTEKGQTEICIYNVLGEVVHTFFSEDVVQYNTREISTDLSRLSTGQYLIILRTPTYVESSRLMILK